MFEGLIFDTMTKLHSILIAFLFALPSFLAQTDEPISINRSNSYLIIPHEPKLYISSVDQHIAQKTGLSYQQIRNGFRQKLVEQLMDDFMELGKTNTLLSDSIDVREDLTYTYHSIGYKYEEVPEDENIDVKTLDRTKDKISKTFNRLIPKKEAEELDIKREEKEHFMKTSIHSPYLLNNLQEKYGTNRFVFINQLDIIDEPESLYSYGDYSNDNFNRVMRVHYTIINQDGKILAAGLAKKEFSANIANPNMIVQLTMPGISHFIVEKIASVDKKAKEEESDINKF